MRSDILVAAVIIGLCAFAVIKQLDAGDEEVIPKLVLGEALDPDTRVTLIGDPPFTDSIGAYMGEKATVFMSWSVPCPCTDKVEARLKHVYMKFLPRDGIKWIAVDGEPLDQMETGIIDTPWGEEHREGIWPKMGRLKAFYKMILDPRQRLCKKLGLFQASVVAVFDKDRKLVYRGTIDADYEKGKAEHLEDVLSRLVGTKDTPADPNFEPFEREFTYGCLFNDPMSCFEYLERDKKGAAE
ncbi:MAG: hypothetical protein QNJ98_13600 [Planctomycetota bacterium]|nr:hypothetical protein [Planctomycetota bacterium]